MTTEEVAGRLREALTTRQVIAHAEGVIMGRQGISADAASANLRQTAKRAGVDVRESAAEVLASALLDNLIGQV